MGIFIPPLPDHPSLNKKKIISLIDEKTHETGLVLDLKERAMSIQNNHTPQVSQVLGSRLDLTTTPHTDSLENRR